MLRSVISFRFSGRLVYPTVQVRLLLESRASWAKLFRGEVDNCSVHKLSCMASRGRFSYCANTSGTGHL